MTNKLNLYELNYISNSDNSLLLLQIILKQRSFHRKKETYLNSSCIDLTKTNRIKIIWILQRALTLSGGYCNKACKNNLRKKSTNKR